MDATASDVATRSASCIGPLPTVRSGRPGSRGPRRSLALTPRSAASFVDPIAERHAPSRRAHELARTDRPRNPKHPPPHRSAAAASSSSPRISASSAPTLDIAFRVRTAWTGRLPGERLGQLQVPVVRQMRIASGRWSSRYSAGPHGSRRRTRGGARARSVRPRAPCHDGGGDERRRQDLEVADLPRGLQVPLDELRSPVQPPTVRQDRRVGETDRARPASPPAASPTRSRGPRVPAPRPIGRRRRASRGTRRSTTCA